MSGDSPATNQSQEDIFRGIDVAAAPNATSIGSNASTQIIAANNDRKAIYIWNEVGQVAYFGFGTNDAEKNKGMALADDTGIFLRDSALIKLAINGVSTDDGVICYQEFE